MNKKPVLVVMAAGMGSRYGGLKQIDPVGAHGEKILDYSVYDAHRAGFETVVFIIKEEISALFKEAVGRRMESVMNVRYAYQEITKLPAGYTVPEGRKKPWGTAHAVLCAKDEIGDAPFAVINADDYYGPEAYQLIYDYLTAHADAPARESYAMVGYLLKNTVTENGYVSRGVCETNADHVLLRVTERTHIEQRAHDIAFSEDGGNTFSPLDENTIVSMNLWGFPAAFLSELSARFPAFLDKALVENPLKGEYFLPGVVSALIDEDKAAVTVLSTHDKWYGVTYPEDKPSVVAAIAQKTSEGIYPAPIW